ncbi:MAG: hypothetical protein IJS58_09915 [Bacilli bacterium]|nr:hypothetical protein [Bacilli bacterium]
MENFKIEITEYFQKQIDVDCNSEEEALGIIKEKYDNGEIRLNETNYIDTDIEIYDENKFISKLELLQDRIDKFNKDRDWDQFHSPANLSKSISIEAAELLECFQWNDEKYDISEVEEELADVLNYCLQMCNVLRCDPIDIVNKKMDKTEKKYPVDKSRGVYTKYTKL